MENSEMIKKIEKLIKANLEVEIPAEIKGTDRIFDDLGIDSIMLMQLVVYLEEEFSIEFPEEEVDPENFQTINSLVEFINSLKSKEPK